jgi:hypothetical protein
MTALAIRLSTSATASAGCTAPSAARMWHGVWPDVCRRTTCRSATSPTACTCRPGSVPTMAGCSPTASAALAGRRRRAALAPRRAHPAGRAVARAAAQRASMVEHVRATWPPRRAPRRGRRVDGVALDPDALTIVFARRFATYKRATLLLSQPERLMKLLRDASGRSSSSSPARRTRRTCRARRCSGDRAVRAAARVPRPLRLPRGLRRRAGAAPGAGRRRLAERAAAAVRGQRHERHEGRRQRRAEPEHPRRLVGRGVGGAQPAAGADRLERRGGRAVRTSSTWTGPRPAGWTGIAPTPTRCSRCSSRRSCRCSTAAATASAEAGPRRMRSAIRQCGGYFNTHRMVREYVESRTCRRCSAAGRVAGRQARARQGTCSHGACRPGGRRRRSGPRRRADRARGPAACCSRAPVSVLAWPAMADGRQEAPRV